MDWTKAKTILIIALLITNNYIGYSYNEKLKEAEKQQIAQAISTEAFLEQLGINVQADIPTKPLKKPVLFVRFEELQEGEYPEPVFYDDMLVEASDYKNRKIVPLSYGETKRDISSASDALLKAISSFKEIKDSPLTISDITLLYLVENADYEQVISEDTAVPTWKITMEAGATFYINAYGE